MHLISAKVGPFKSINEPQEVRIDDQVTVLVGMNEAGKTVFLQALEKSDDVLDIAEFDPVSDYPRKDLSWYMKEGKTKGIAATILTYQLNQSEVDLLNSAFHTNLKGLEFSVTHRYDNTLQVTLEIDEKAAIKFLLSESKLGGEAKAKLKTASTIREIPEILKEVNLTNGDKTFLTGIEERIEASSWDTVLAYEVWKWLKPRIPQFLYFGDYDLLPSKMNLTDLAQRVSQAEANPKILEAKHRAVLALLRMADISIADFTKPGGYEQLKAKIESVSINLTDRIMEFWKQNEDLEVEVDIKQDPDDHPPYNAGPNLYLRIKNRRHRGVSTPFQQRSRGFIWFFSFLVWFDSVKLQIDGDEKRDLILLLDEPGLSLHAIAQADFLNYIDELARKHQVIYTTHSPFMIRSERLHQVRVVEDQAAKGTVISDNISASDPRTIFPLQAALGWTIAQNLFISEKNLLVEGPSELIYLKSVSSILEKEGRTGLRDDLTIVPAGGLDKVVTFIALLGASGLKLAVLHDYRGMPEQKLIDLVRQKMISAKAVLNVSQFRDLANIGKNGSPSDIEDLFTASVYLEYFNPTFAKQIRRAIKENDLPAGDRIVDRIERYISAKNIQLRPSGGFNHFAVASHFASNPPASLDAETLNRFEALFAAVNALF